MKGILVETFEPPTQLLAKHLQLPELTPGEVHVSMHSAAVNFACALMAMGGYQVKPRLPFVPGIEGAGTIMAIGDSVTDFSVGDRVFVMGFIGESRTDRTLVGSWAEECVVPITNLALIPSGMPFETAALFRTVYETSYFALQLAQIKKNDVLLVLGAGGATGRAAIEIARSKGAFIIASASTNRKREIALDAGANVTIDSRADDWRTSIRHASPHRPINVVFDPIGGEKTELALRSLGWGGKHLMIGFAAGHIPSLPTNLPLMKGASLLGVNYLGFLENEPEAASANFAELLELYKNGAISDPVIDRTCYLEELEETSKSVLNGEIQGRALLRFEDHPGSRTLDS